MAAITALAAGAYPGGKNTASLESWGTIGTLITPGNTDLSPIPKGVIMLAAGDITILCGGATDDTQTLTFTGVPGGFIPPYFVRRVTACSSSCATIRD